MMRMAMATHEIRMVSLMSKEWISWPNTFKEKPLGKGIEKITLNSSSDSFMSICAKPLF
jgi:hypothetical protein